MAPLFLVFALIIQSSFIYAENENVSREILDSAPEHATMKEFRAIDTDWLELFTLPKNHIHPTSAAAQMSHITNSDKSAEEQLEEIKKMAHDINLAIQKEMANLLSYALSNCEEETHENGLRKKRSLESPVDSSQLVLRLLKHIKNNNEYQNIAIEKMMSAQEIADKFGIEYTPDPEILTEFAVASNKQAEELASILKDASEMRNVTTEIEFVPLAEEPVKSTENDSYFGYTVHPEDIVAHQNALPEFEFIPEYIQHPRPAHYHYEHYPQYNYYETQIPPPQYHRSPPVTPMPNFYEPFAFTPAPEYPMYYYPEPITTTTTIVLPIDDFEPEPELVGEEFEETITSKTSVDRGDEPGSATVNHVMTYTISEKSHFKKPQIDTLPQQMQYYFFLM